MRDAWGAMRKLTSRGLTTAELKIMLDSELQNIPHAVEERKKAFEKALPLDMGQLLSIPFIIAGFLLLWYVLRKEKGLKG